MREFFTTFWTEVAGHVAVSGDDLRSLDVPDAVRAQHEAYIAALDAIVDSTDDRVAEIRSRDAALLTDDADEAIKQLIELNRSNPEFVDDLRVHRALLANCRDRGIRPAFKARRA